MARASSLSDVLKSATGGEFILVQLIKGARSPEPLYDGDGQLLMFKDGSEAGKAADDWTDKLGHKVQPRRAVDKGWREREARKMKDGTYVMLPWAGQEWWKELAHIHGEHYPHVSLAKTALVAFTEDELKGSADLQIAMKPGRYLERFFTKVLNEHVIRDLCCIFAKQYEDNKLQFADEPDDIEDVYVNGPSSCMSKSAGAYGVESHPTRLYAAGDLQVAYLRREGRVVARSVVWPEKKTYNTIYGDRGRLEVLLTKAGYKPGAPYGARLLKLRHGKGTQKPLYQFVCPHIDNVGWVKDAGEFLVVGGKERKDHEGIDVPGGGGISEVLGYKCTACDQEALTKRQINPYYKGETEATGTMCKDCGVNHTVMCAELGVAIEKSAAVELVGGGWGWTRRVKSGHLTLCQGSGKYAPTSQMIMMPDGSRWSAYHFGRAGKHCDYCGGGHKRTDKVCPRCNGGVKGYLGNFTVGTTTST